MTKDIEKLLAEGATPEDIYQQAIRIVEAKRAADARKSKEKDEARSAAVDAIVKYIEIASGKTMSADVKKELDEYLLAVESILPMVKIVPTKAKSNKEAEDADEMLAAFVKGLGF